MEFFTDDFIRPINKIDFAGQGFQRIDNSNKVKSDFKNVFSQAVQDVIDTDRDYTNKQYLLATGQINNAADVTVAGAKAQLAVELLVQLRNSALNAYNEILRINV